MVCIRYGALGERLSGKRDLQTREAGGSPPLTSRILSQHFVILTIWNIMKVINIESIIETVSLSLSRSRCLNFRLVAICKLKSWKYSPWGHFYTFLWSSQTWTFSCPSRFNFSEFEDTVHCRMVFPEQEEQVFAKGQVLCLKAAWFQETFPGGRCMFLGAWYTDSLSSGIFRKWFCWRSSCHLSWCLVFGGRGAWTLLDLSFLEAVFPPQVCCACCPLVANQCQPAHQAIQSSTHTTPWSSVECKTEPTGGGEKGRLGLGDGWNGFKVGLRMCCLPSNCIHSCG